MKEVIQTDYVITMKNNFEDEYFDNKEEADARFNEIKDSDIWEQYYRKDWEVDTDIIPYEPDEGYVEVYANND